MAADHAGSVSSEGAQLATISASDDSVPLRDLTKSFLTPIGPNGLDANARKQG